MWIGKKWWIAQGSFPLGEKNGEIWIAMPDVTDFFVSDIHFESYRGVFRVRFRVDGVLHEVDRPNLSMQPAVISRLKLMAELDISEK